jgi:hypothetical protein
MGGRFGARSATGRSDDGPDAREAGELARRLASRRHNGSEAGVHAPILIYAAVTRGLIGVVIISGVLACSGLFGLAALKPSYRGHS